MNTSSRSFPLSPSHSHLSVMKKSSAASFRESSHLHPPRCWLMQQLRCLKRPFRDTALSVYRFLASRVHLFWLQLCYFVSLSLVGFLLLRTIPPRGTASAQAPSDLDMFFMAVSAATVSSMSTVEMEFFSNAQLVVLTILMLMGGEVFISMLGLQLRKLDAELDESEMGGSTLVEPRPVIADVSSDHVELGLIMAIDHSSNNCGSETDGCNLPPLRATDQDLKSSGVRCLGLVVLGYLLVVNLAGSSLVLAYLSTVSTAGDVVRSKDISLQVFAIFSVVSSFANCGFIPSNENMIIFRKHSGLLLLVGSVVLAGNTLYPSLLRSAIWVLGRTTGRPGFEYMLKNHREMEYDHLLPIRRCAFLALTVAGFLLVQLVLFCCMEWGLGGLEGMSAYQKLVGALFMSVNSRHAGESIVDLSSVSPAVLVLFVVMMYLPPYATFKPGEQNHEANSGNQEEGKTRRTLIVEGLIPSQLSYLGIFTVLICITERKKLSQDPLNFNVLNIVFEVVSAYGNVGFSMGYSCERRLKPEGDCTNMWFGFSGRWSGGGKLILICVMFFGRFKKFGINKGGRAWILA